MSTFALMRRAPPGVTSLLPLWSASPPSPCASNRLRCEVALPGSSADSTWASSAVPASMSAPQRLKQHSRLMVAT